MQTYPTSPPRHELLHGLILAAQPSLPARASRAGSSVEPEEPALPWAGGKTGFECEYREVIGQILPTPQKNLGIRLSDRFGERGHGWRGHSRRAIAGGGLPQFSTAIAKASQEPRLRFCPNPLEREPSGTTRLLVRTAPGKGRDPDRMVPDWNALPNGRTRRMWTSHTPFQRLNLRSGLISRADCRIGRSIFCARCIRCRTPPTVIFSRSAICELDKPSQKASRSSSE